MERALVGFHQDKDLHWVAELECGRARHVRHEPRWQNRSWVSTAEGRSRFLGVILDCVLCEQALALREAGLAEDGE